MWSLTGRRCRVAGVGGVCPGEGVMGRWEDEEEEGREGIVGCDWGGGDC